MICLDQRSEDVTAERRSSIPKAQTLEEMAEFWDTHSLSDYDDKTYEVEMSFDPSARRTFVGIDPEVLADLQKIARQRRVSVQTLANLWLSQRIEQMKAQGNAAD